MNWHRRRLSLSEFDDRCRRLEELYPGISETSGRRSDLRNANVGAKGKSHVYGLGRDYVFDETMDLSDIGTLYTICKALGLWAQWHDAGSGPHLHVQGCPPA
jgi:hypothetical protein